MLEVDIFLNSEIFRKGYFLNSESKKSVNLSLYLESISKLKNRHHTQFAIPACPESFFDFGRIPDALRLRE